MSTLQPPLARPAGMLADLGTVALRAVRQMVRDVQSVLPSLFIGVFFYVVQVGSLQDVFEAPGRGVGDYKAFLLPMGIVFAITGVSRATALVTDIQGGYFDRLLVTPVARPALLLGLMLADVVAVLALAVAVTAIGLLIGVEFATGPAGVVVFLALAALWGLAFAGFPYAVALRTGSPSAVGVTSMLFLPFAFLTTAFVPQQAMTGWMAATTRLNPVTYLLEAMRALIGGGWELAVIGRGFAAVALVLAVTFWLSLRALAGRVSRG
jgi:ABC-2 type transport system permease protein